MDTKTTIQSQYLAALAMLRQTIEDCPDALWTADGPENAYWHVAYHTLFFTHLYLQESEKAFTPWEKHIEEYQFLGPLPWPPHDLPKIGEPYSKEDMLAYHGVCVHEVAARVPETDLTAESGFFWLEFGKLELQFYNIRHIQHHAGQLSDRLRNEAGIGLGWVGKA